jgi:hypothetical protein
MSVYGFSSVILEMFELFWNVNQQIENFYLFWFKLASDQTRNWIEHLGKTLKTTNNKFAFKQQWHSNGEKTLIYLLFNYFNSEWLF